MKLTYFDIQGVAEKVRLALVLQDVPFEDERIKWPAWAEMKPTTKYGQLPLLTIDGKKTITQSDAMLRFVARLKSSTLYPKKVEEQLVVDEILGLCGDFTKAWTPCLYMGMRPETYGYDKDSSNTDEGKARTEKIRILFVKEKLPTFMGYFSDLLSTNKFLAGNEVTIADCAFLPIIARFSTGDMDFVPADSLDAYPTITAYMTRMRDLPKIKAWYAPKVEEKVEEQVVEQKKRVLMVLTSNDKLGETGEQTGWYLPEVAHPHWAFIEAGYELTYASIKGGVAPVDVESIEASPDEGSQKFQTDDACQKLVNETMPIAEAKAEDYDVVFYAGGFGTMWDFPDSEASAKLAGEVYDQGGIVAAVCHGPSALINIKLADGTLLVKGKKVTAFTNAEEDAVKRREVVPWTCEDKLTELGAEFVDGGVFKECVQVSDRLMTGQNPPSAGALAKTIIEALSK